MKHHPTAVTLLASIMPASSAREWQRHHSDPGDKGNKEATLPWAALRWRRRSASGKPATMCRHRSIAAAWWQHLPSLFQRHGACLLQQPSPAWASPTRSRRHLPRFRDSVMVWPPAWAMLPSSTTRRWALPLPDRWSDFFNLFGRIGNFPPCFCSTGRRAALRPQLRHGGFFYIYSTTSLNIAPLNQ